MGVPAFYRWLSARYPKIVQDAVEDEADVVAGEEIPVDGTEPNPNGVEFDNLYLDMNGIIHPCFHPEDRPAPTTEVEVFQNIFEYIDRLMLIVRPRKLLYMAIDGVAPRAKMNQQRSRRFRAAQEAEERAKAEEKLRAKLESQGTKLPPRGAKSEVVDSNAITPGTPFMGRLSAALQYYIHRRLNENRAWRQLKVILSDSNVPGEGEHKVMQYIREQRGLPGWDPNTKHVIYGLDADLIMLALATHEPWFYILREVVTPPPQRDPRATILEQAMAAQTKKREVEKPVSKKPYQFLKCSVLREYLVLDLAPSDVNHRVDKERVFDDFVFMCFFVGNDFLPHMPTLEIREGAIETLMTVYRRELPRLGHLVQGPHIYLDRVEQFIQIVGSFEDAIFAKRKQALERQKRRIARDRADKNRMLQGLVPGGDFRDGGQRATGPGAGSGAAWMGGDKSKAQVAKERKLAEAVELARAVGQATPLPMPGGGDEARPWEGGGGKRGREEGTGPGTVGATNKDAAAELRAKILSGVKRAKGDGEGQAAAVSSAPASVPTPAADAASSFWDSLSAAPKAEGGAAGIEPATAGDAGPQGSAATPDVKSGGDGGHAGSKSSGKKRRWGEAVGPANGAGHKEGAKEDGAVAVTGDGGVEVAGVAVGDEAVGEEEDEGDDEELVDDELNDLGEEGDAVLAALAEEVKENEKAFKAKMSAMLDSQKDMFDAMVEEERGIRLHESGWKERYYMEKLGATKETLPAVIRRVVEAFVRGLAWVMRYYYDSVASWSWYYPEHYAPFASDLVDLSSIDIRFELGRPFKPFNQLMGVLPAASKHCLPEAYRWLFDSPQSPILDFYPKDFKLDMNGKRFAWQAVALLPFIDEKRLLDAVALVEGELSEEERYRNSQRLEMLFVHAEHPLAPATLELAHLPPSSTTPPEAPIDPAESQGMNGTISAPMGDPMPAVLEAPFGLGEPVRNNNAVCALYRLPAHHPHKCTILEGTVLPPLECTEMDRPAVEQMWHLSQAGGGPRPHYHGGGGGGRGYGGHPGGANPGGHPSARNGPGQAGWDRAHVPVAHLAPESQQFLQHELGRGGQPGPRGPGGYGPGYGGYGGGGGGGSVTFGQQQGMNVAAGRGMGRGAPPQPQPHAPPFYPGQARPPDAYPHQPPPYHNPPYNMNMLPGNFGPNPGGVYPPAAGNAPPAYGAPAMGGPGGFAGQQGYGGGGYGSSGGFGAVPGDRYGAMAGDRYGAMAGDRYGGPPVGRGGGGRGGGGGGGGRGRGGGRFDALVRHGRGAGGY